MQKQTTLHEATVNETALNEFEDRWKSEQSRLEMIPGKEALSALNQKIQEMYQVTLTSTSIIDSMMVDEIPDDMEKLVQCIAQFGASSVP